MATVTRFVNTASTTGGNGTTNDTTGANRAYPTLGNWNTNEAADLTVHEEVTVSSISGTFVIDENLSFSSSSATGQLKILSGSTMTYEILTGTPTTADTITGDTSTATCDIDTIDASGSQHIVNCTGSSADTTGNFIIGSWTTDATDFITINGENTTGGYSTSDYRMEFTMPSTNDFVFRASEAFTVINDIQVQATNTAHVSCIGLSMNTIVHLNRCIAKGVTSGGDTNGFNHSFGGNSDWRACLVYDFTESGDTGFRGSFSEVIDDRWDNLTAHNCDVGFSYGSSDVTLQNCLAQDCTDGFGPNPTSATTCCSDITDDLASGQTQTGNVSFVDEAGDDFQPASGDTLVNGNGTDLSGTFDFDLKGNAPAVPWTIGCLDAQVAAGGRIMSSLANYGGLAAHGGIAGKHGGLAA